MTRRHLSNSWPRYWLWGLMALMLLVPATPARALQAIGVSPTSQELELAPGQTAKGQLTVINDGDTDITYRVYATDYTVNDEDYRGAFTTSGAPANVSPTSWFKLPAGPLVAQARQQTKLDYTLSAPAGATVGGHYAAVFIETIPPPASGGAIVSRVDRVGSLFYIATAGDLKQHGRLLPLDVPWLQTTAPLTAKVRINNDGNVHFAVEGTIQLSSLFGKASEPVNFKGEVLPETTRRFALGVSPDTPIGLYNVTAKVHYLDRDEQVSRWVLLVPPVTLAILGVTYGLLLVLAIIWIIRNVRRRA